MTWRDILGERIEDHHDILTCPTCRASYDGGHLNRDGTCPSCGGQVVCPECQENTVDEGAKRCTNCEDAAAEAGPVRIMVRFPDMRRAKGLAPSGYLTSKRVHQCMFTDPAKADRVAAEIREQNPEATVTVQPFR